jgi:CrcB protein
MRFLWVGVGGAAASIARYAIGLGVDQPHFPWATLGINLSAAFALGLFLTVALGHLSVAVMTPIAVGLIGGFTTFSTLMWEGFTFSRTDRAGIVLTYVSVSVIGGFVAAWAATHSGDCWSSSDLCERRGVRGRSISAAIVGVAPLREVRERVCYASGPLDWCWPGCSGWGRVRQFG